MRFRVVFTDLSLRKLGALEKITSERVIEKLEKVSENPFAYATKMKVNNFYKTRVGDYRIIFLLDNRNLSISVVDIGHRSTIYKKY